MRAGDVGIAAERVKNQDGVRALGVELAPGLVGEGIGGKGATAIEGQGVAGRVEGVEEGLLKIQASRSIQRPSTFRIVKSDFYLLADMGADEVDELVGDLVLGQRDELVAGQQQQIERLEIPEATEMVPIDLSPAHGRLKLDAVFAQGQHGAAAIEEAEFLGAVADAHEIAGDEEGGNDDNGDGEEGPISDRLDIKDDDDDQQDEGVELDEALPVDAPEIMADGLLDDRLGITKNNSHCSGLKIRQRAE